VTPLEAQLSSELKAESELVEPGSIPSLQLPGPALRSLGGPRRVRLRRLSPRRWPAWATALAAAAAVLAVIAGALTVAHAISAAGPAEPVSPALYSGVPPYYAYAVSGNIYSTPKSSESVIARYVKVRSTASGKLLTTVRPPAPYDAFEGFTGSASDRTFVFAAQWYQHPKQTGTPRIYKLDQKTPLKFMILRITPGGRPQLSPLSLPVKLTEGEAPTFALSPDGTRLAVAYGGSGQPAVVQVITLATGQLHQWVSPKPAATPVLTGIGAWTADGRTLVLGQEVIARNGIISTIPARVRLLDTAAPGTDLGTASKLITLRGAGLISWPFTTPDGTSLISETGRPFKFSQTTASGALGVFSPRTGALLRTEARWHRHLGQNDRIGAGFTQAVLWSNFSGSRLVVETPHGNANGIGFLSGGRFTPLPHAAQGPLLFAVNAGGFQTSGGYVGFAW
jgi:hypothetical protein